VLLPSSCDCPALALCLPVPLSMANEEVNSPFSDRCSCACVIDPLLASHAAGPAPASTGPGATRVVMHWHNSSIFPFPVTSPSAVEGPGRHRVAGRAFQLPPGSLRQFFRHGPLSQPFSVDRLLPARGPRAWASRRAVPLPGADPLWLGPTGADRASAAPALEFCNFWYDYAERATHTS
jgi:hypothetical protein